MRADWQQLSGKEFYDVTTQVQEGALSRIGCPMDITMANVIAFRGVNYEITRIDAFEGCREDFVLYCKVKESYITNYNFNVYELSLAARQRVKFIGAFVAEGAFDSEENRFRNVLVPNPAR